MSADFFHDWRSAISDEDRAVYRAAGYGGRLAIGNRPALLVIDATYAFVGRADRTAAESLAEFPTSAGVVAWDAVRVIARLRRAFREHELPVVYSIAPEDSSGLVGLWSEKTDHAKMSAERANMVVAEIQPEQPDITLRKTKPSIFHGTALIEMLVRHSVDTLVVTGGTTSGCVRATVVDAFSYNYPTLVVEDGVFDRGALSHAVNLFDMEQKYAEVVRSDRIMSLLSTQWSVREPSGNRAASKA